MFVFFSAGLLVAIPIVNWALVSAQQLQFAWLSTIVFMLLFCVQMGARIVGRVPGVLIDERNVMSLSRLQTVLWTVVVLSAFITAALYNVFNYVASPLAIAIPSQVWLALGISTASLVGTPLILGQKAQKDVPPSTVATAVANVAQTSGQAAATITNQGTVIGNNSAKLAAWTDVVTGDEITNGAHLDLAKVQMLFFTIVIVAVYAFALWRMFTLAQCSGIVKFPVLDESTIALMGISHSGYLLNKAVPR